MARVKLAPEVADDLAQILLTTAGPAAPKARRKAVMAAIKEADPNFQLPSDIAQEVLEEKIEAKFTDRDLTAAQQRTKADLEAQRRGLIDGSLIPGRKYDEETVKTKLEPWMEKNGISDYKQGAVLYAHDNPPPNPRPEIRTAGQWTMPKVKDPFDSASLTRTARERAYGVIDEIQAGR